MNGTLAFVREKLKIFERNLKIVRYERRDEVEI